jgi:hypothetical protein
MHNFGNLPTSLPRTISDSVAVTAALGKGYLWVDSICIYQSDPIDKAAQIAAMDAIYQGAFATIIALDGEDADSGLPGSHSLSPRLAQFSIEFSPGDTMIEKFPSLHEQLKSSSWATRAWTFQKGILSRRRIAFTKHQTYFLFNEMECTETLDNAKSFNTGKNPRGFTDHALRDPLLGTRPMEGLRRKQPTPWQTYLSLVQKYIHRDM